MFSLKYLLIYTIKMAESATTVKLFGKWTLDDVEVNDLALVDFVAVKGKHATFVAHTAGRYQRKRFRKAQVSLLHLCWF